MNTPTEYAPIATIEQQQLQQLQAVLQYVASHSTYYQRLFDTHAIDIATIQTLKDLTKIPITTKEHLQTHNEDFLCVPKSAVVDYVTTSGTLGKPVTLALTDTDLDRLATNEAHALRIAGITSEEVVQITTTLDKRFMAGVAYFLGIRKIGAAMVRVGAGVPALQWDSIQRFQSTYLIAVPSFLLKLIAYAEANGIDYKNTSVKAAVCIGEPIRNQDFTLNALGQSIQEKWDIALYATYASTEMSTAFTECAAQQGGHHQPELIITEVVDDQGIPVADGAVGELVITTLGVEAMPLIRYATGDMVQVHTTPCSCGRTTQRLSPILGRKKQMIKYKGTTLYPQSIIEVLNSHTAVTLYIIEVRTDAIGMDAVYIHLEDTLHASDQKALKAQLQAQLRVIPEIVLHTQAELHAMKYPVMSRKPIIFIDNRTS